MTCMMNNGTLEDKYLDMMIRLAFDETEERETERVLSSGEEDGDLPDAEAFDRAFYAALDSALRNVQKEKRKKRACKTRRLLMRTGNIAACVILLAALTLPAAMATSPELKRWASGLLADVDNENGKIEFSFDKSTSSAVPVPEGWTGEWYPTYIPENMLLEEISCDSHLLDARYRGADGIAVMTFSEMNEDCFSLIGTENSNVKRIDINGAEGWLVTGHSDTLPVTVTFSYGYDCWFELDSFGLPAEEVIAVARSIRRTGNAEN